MDYIEDLNRFVGMSHDKKPEQQADGTEFLEADTGDLYVSVSWDWKPVVKGVRASRVRAESINIGGASLWADTYGNLRGMVGEPEDPDEDGTILLIVEIEDYILTQTPDLQEDEDNAGVGEVAGTLKAIRGTPPYTFALATGSEGNDANNGNFGIDGDELLIVEDALTAGTYKIFIKVTDANEKTFAKASTIEVLAKAEAGAD